ncbi:hypothetical protein AMTRI_Chr12g272530 [Amborella trichopoda]|uniref:protein-serine/threonine phosphatase n=1 Tax=Amborella trichopoda TaxID=13333 RepID=U5D8N5_AMBTC|nr:probable protein phosphatase 2C 25 [Amborella trichopoda]ERN18560.1 hypothetical protein AMTR_s00065p00110200 [Amborella trichopoda]|eukprot:XP_006857093.1 probable protein phosphatase 2C 25 [Amborella trichopoda]
MSCAVVAGSPVFKAGSPLKIDHHLQPGYPGSPLRCGFVGFREESQGGSPSLRQMSNGIRVWEEEGLGFSRGEEAVKGILKRKRPARLQIPSSSPCASGFEPIEQGPELVHVESDRYSVICKRGRRSVMEDCYAANLDLYGDSKQAFLGVFDGHGGKRAAEFAAQNMGKNIMELATNCDGVEGIGDAVKNGYLVTDSEFLRDKARGGACCVTALIREGNLVVSNAGDCRAVMSRGGTAEALTSDHRPAREDERERIESLGGYVDLRRGVWRLQGCLAVSRGIGDQHLKQWVSAEPETEILRITPECEFLILASDGLWEKVGNQEAIDLARPLCATTDKPSPLSACKKLVDLSLSRGSLDDISVMIIQLSRFV